MVTTLIGYPRCALSALAIRSISARCGGVIIPASSVTKLPTAGAGGNDTWPQPLPTRGPTTSTRDHSRRLTTAPRRFTFLASAHALTRGPHVSSTVAWPPSVLTGYW